jgi:hypothetical protein
VRNGGDLTVLGRLFDARIAPCRNGETSADRFLQILRLGDPDSGTDGRGLEVRLEGRSVAPENEPDWWLHGDLCVGISHPCTSPEKDTDCDEY